MKEHPIYKDYFITEDGKVFSNKQGTLKELKPFVNSSGYLIVGIQVEKLVSKQKRVHRLVAETYIPNSDNLPQVDHIDENKKNNEVSNLQWVTHQRNSEKSKCKNIWIVQTPDNEILEVYNLNKYCRDNSLKFWSLYYTLPENREKHWKKHYKGHSLLKKVPINTKI